jgi:glycosyltransferase involved in cell wall biosynthesis
MKQTPEQMALQHSLALCQGHADALQDALQDIHTRAMDVNDYTTLSKQDRRIVAPRAVARAAAILTVSETSKLEICTEYNLHLDRVTVVPNTLPEMWFQGNPISNQMGPNARPYILAVSGAAPSKNLHRLIRAFAKAQQSEEVSGINLVVVGVGQREQTRFKQLADENSVGERVVLCSRVSDEELKSLYRNASLFVFPSTDEGFGNPLLEAMFVGTPVICSFIQVFHEVGLLHVGYFDPFSIDDIGKALLSGLSCGRDDKALLAAKNHARTYSFCFRSAEISGLFKKILVEHV